MTNVAVVCALPVSPVLDNKPETKNDLQTADAHDDAHALDSPDADAHDTAHASDTPAFDAYDAKDDFEICQPCADQTADALVAQPRAQMPKPLVDVKMSSASEIARYCLAHIPCRRWCRWCVMSRMPNVAHKQLPPFSR